MGVQKKTRKFAQVGHDYPCCTDILTWKSIQVKRIIGQRDARLKKNQDKAVIESKRKSKDDLVREMSVSSHSVEPSLSNVSQTSSFLVSFLPIQHRYVSFSSDSLQGARVSRPTYTCLVASNSSRSKC